MGSNLSKCLKKGMAALACIVVVLTVAPINVEAGYYYDPSKLGVVNHISYYDCADINNSVATYKLDSNGNFAICPTNSNYVTTYPGVEDGDGNDFTYYDFNYRENYLWNVCEDIRSNHPELVNTDYNLMGYSLRDDNSYITSEQYDSLELTVIDSNSTITIPGSLPNFPTKENDIYMYTDCAGISLGTDVRYTIRGINEETCEFLESAYSVEVDDNNSATVNLAEYMDRYDAFELRIDVNYRYVNDIVPNRYTFVTGSGVTGNIGITRYFVTKRGLEKFRNGKIAKPLAFFKLADQIGGYTGMSYVNNTWRYLVNGAVDYNYTGMACNEYGWWYFRNGNLDWNYTGMACNDYGWWYYQNGRLDWNYTGMACNDYGWWYYRNGNLDWNYTGMACNDYGWWYYRNGNLDWNYTGMACNDYGWWYYQNGRLDWNYTGMACNDYGWWYYRNGNLDWNYTGMACNEYGWWYYQNGNLDWNYTGMACNEYGWWYYQNGRLDWNYTGLGYNEYGAWLYNNGSIAWDYTGNWNGYNVVNGHLA